MVVTPSAAFSRPSSRRRTIPWLSARRLISPAGDRDVDVRGPVTDRVLQHGAYEADYRFLVGRGFDPEV